MSALCHPHPLKAPASCAALISQLPRPTEMGEAAIAAALGLEPHDLWAERYHASGQRKSQPPQNRKRLRTMRQRRNDEAA